MPKLRTSKAGGTTNVGPTNQGNNTMRTSSCNINGNTMIYYTHTYIYIHIYIYIHTYIYTYTLKLSKVFGYITPY